MALAPRNFLELVPHRLEADVHRDGERFVIRSSRFRSRPGKLLGQLLGRSEYLSLKLDARTGYCYELMDGKRDMQEICRLASERFGDQVEPVVPRMIELVKILERNKLIKFV